jgi:hypothetical protein
MAQRHGGGQRNERQLVAKTLLLLVEVHHGQAQEGRYLFFREHVTPGDAMCGEKSGRRLRCGESRPPKLHPRPCSGTNDGTDVAASDTATGGDG